MSRPSFRPRPLDIHQKLTIVRDPKEISAEEMAASRAVQHSHMALDKDNDEVQTVRGDKGTQEIPVPDVKVVENYADDVKPNYVIPESYVRFTGNSLVSPEFTPYDLDSEDETWLAAYNGDQQRLPADRFERLLYTLEATCSAFVEKRFQVDAAVAAERGAVISLVERQALVASTSTLSKQAALEALRPSGAREVVCNAVFDYWAAKRERRQKPLMRPYQMPPPVTDTNPYNVFRPREKISRPQTRRKRENDHAAYQKMAEIRRNMAAGLFILEAVAKRERRKRDLINMEVELQLVQLKLKYDPHSTNTVEESMVPLGVGARNKGRPQQGGAGGAGLLEVQRLLGMDGKSGLVKKHSKHGRKHRRDRAAAAQRERAEVAKKLRPMPPEPLPQMLFALDVDLDACVDGMPPEMDRHRSRARFGRGGRMVFDRCNPLNPVNTSQLDSWVQ